MCTCHMTGNLILKIVTCGTDETNKANSKYKK